MAACAILFALRAKVGALSRLRKCPGSHLVFSRSRLPLDEAVVLLAEAEEERQSADRELEAILRKLGLGKTE